MKFIARWEIHCQQICYELFNFRLKINTQNRKFNIFEPKLLNYVSSINKFFFSN